MAALVKDASPDLKVVLDDSGAGTIDHVSFDYRSVAILRPWFKSSALTSRIWRSDDPELNLSDGGDPPKGSCPAYATAVIFIRNLQVTQRAADAAPPTLTDLRFTIAANRLTRRDLTIRPQIMFRPRASGPAVQDGPVALGAQIAFRRLNQQTLSTAPIIRRHGAISFRQMVGRVNPAVFAQRFNVPIQVVIAAPGGPAPTPAPEPTPTPVPPPPPPPPADDISVLAFVCKRLPKTPDALPTLQWN